MIDLNRQHLQLSGGQRSNRERTFDLDFLETNRGVHVVWNACEVRPGVVVEQMSPHTGKDSLGAEYRNRFVARAEGVFDQEREGVGVIHVSVRDHHMANMALLVDRQRPGDGARIHRDAPIDQKRRHPALGAVTPETAEHPKIHATSIPVTLSVRYNGLMAFLTARRGEECG